MMRIRIDLAYDGGGFHGWAKQPGLRTIQGEIEHAMATVLRVADADIRLTVAGRTDSGVHASHQVCHADIDAGILERCVGHMGVPATAALHRRLRHMLDGDIAIHGIAVAPRGFDARFSALDRTYVYRLCDGGRPTDPRLRGCVLGLDETLDIALMNQAAAMMLGLHDFGSFAQATPDGTTIREVKGAHWERVATRPLIEPGGMLWSGDVPAPDPTPGAESDGPYSVPTMESGVLCFTIVADAFAHNMVRSLVNACVKVGAHRKSLSWFEQHMAIPLREGATGPIAARGLTLEHVAYPSDGELAARAQSIRAKREL